MYTWEYSDLHVNHVSQLELEKESLKLRSSWAYRGNSCHFQDVLVQK